MGYSKISDQDKKVYNMVWQKRQITFFFKWINYKIFLHFEKITQYIEVDKSV